VSAVSVIVPTYNCAHFLQQSLDSMMAQTVPPAEVIVVDDGSTDETPAVLARYGSRIIVVRGEHAGYAAARNLGLRRAGGEWVAFHDADDVALPDRLAAQLETLRLHANCEAVFCDGERMTETGAATGDRVVPARLARVRDGRILGAADLFDGFPAFFQGALVARQAFAAVGDFDVTLPVYTDMEYGYRLFARGASLFVDRVVFRYRSHAGNVTRDRLQGRQDIARILERIDRDDPEAVRLIGRHRLRRRLARHYYRIGRRQLALGNPFAARPAFRRAAELRPLNPRYQLGRLWHGRGPA
jgi:glycosyltransferase involved in cell wall biosynthesis